MCIYSNDNIRKIAKLTTRELPQKSKNAEITVRENNGLYSIRQACSKIEASLVSLFRTWCFQNMQMTCNLQAFGNLIALIVRQACSKIEASLVSLFQACFFSPKHGNEMQPSSFWQPDCTIFYFDVCVIWWRSDGSINIQEYKKFGNLCCCYRDINDWISPLNKP